jgi:hypothetical protein
MKNKNLIIIFILQLVIILGLFAYFYNRDKKDFSIVYLSIVSSENNSNKLKYDINEIDEYLFQNNGYQQNESEIDNKANLNLKVGDTVYVKLDQSSGRTTSMTLATNDFKSINSHTYYEYEDMEKKPFIIGTIVEIKAGEQQGDSNKYRIEYGIEEGEFVAGNLAGAVAKVKINSQGKSTLLEVYQDNKVIYKSLE